MRRLPSRYTAPARLLLLAAAISACSDDDAAGTDAAVDATADTGTRFALAEVVTGLGSALLSIWTADGEMYAVGADTGGGPLVLRREGSEFTPLATGLSGHLWWVTDAGPDTLLMSGEGGLLVEHTRGSSDFTTIPTGTDKTLYGTWSAPTGETWSVGGDVMADDNRGVVLMRDGDTFVPDPGFPAEIAGAVTLFKVWGTAADDVWIVGERGTVVHFDGSAWSPVEVDAETRLLTIHGSAERGPVAVGGAGNGMLLYWTGDSFVDRSPEFIPALNGIRVPETGPAFAVGNQGVVAYEEGEQWQVIEELITRYDLHAVTVDETGAPWAVGGNLSSGALDEGVIVGPAALAPQGGDGGT